MVVSSQSSVADMASPPDPVTSHRRMLFLAVEILERYQSRVVFGNTRQKKRWRFSAHEL